ncbi:hypothetical protein BVRB_8g186920 [Beta vulgaris subsp. vulgaris]|nr:hypothetical protein BVRB_8g186920 [Beta vulgaris subsp. vulgaris]
MKYQIYYCKNEISFHVLLFKFVGIYYYLLQKVAY